MGAKLIVVSGTGTSIGKTHVSAALVRAWSRRGRVVGLKPIETGVSSADNCDAARLEHASSFPVKLRMHAFAAPVSPHIAAAQDATPIDVAVVANAVGAVRDGCDGVLVELPGGLFTPLSLRASNVDLARALEPDLLLLIAPDRLGVLHDVIAATRAAHAAGVEVTGVALVHPERADSSTGTNAGELRAFLRGRVFGSVPRMRVEDLEAHPTIVAALHALA